jgi:transcriptional regulator with XRE-family HTH domain
MPSKLKMARGKRSPVETARQLGISYQYLNMIENGKRNVPSDVLVKMCKLYSIKDILELTDESEKILPHG